MVSTRIIISSGFLGFILMSLIGIKTTDVSDTQLYKNDLEAGLHQDGERMAIDIGLVVSDMDASLGFYRDMLGLEQVGEITTKLIGKGQMIQLKHGSSLIKLLKMESPAVASKEGFVDVIGYRYITLIVPNIDTIIKRIEKENVATVMPLTELGNGAKILMVKDPDGNVVEFVQP